MASKWLLCAVLGLMACCANAQAEVDLFFAKKKGLTSSSTAEKTLQAAQSWIGSPYRAGTLEGPGDETLRINLRELDCWTLVEYAVALALCKADYADFQQWVVRLRYRNGVMDGYGSRLHYFSEWLLQARDQGLLRDLTGELGGIPLGKSINYISKNADRYPAQAREPAQAQKIAEAEQRISRAELRYIPQDQIRNIESALKAGDIIAMVSAKPGLDIAHQGFAAPKNGRVFLLHASSVGARKVLVSNQPLADYVAGIPGQIGIMVARLNDQN